SLGRPVDDLYVNLGEPIAAASIAQVHPAYIKTDGEDRKVAVKVVRPGVRQRFNNDLESFFLVAKWQERYVPATRRLRPIEVTRTL
ncbi:AarF/UbiB family protein, partial [Raoultella planticola]|uniref:AarF/UbiB family protein n=2 Tax=Pseudomonadota TaxID=1224 RepID=UPI00223A78B6